MPRFERITILPHALERMGYHGITEGRVRAVLEEPDEEGAAKLGRLYAQRLLGGRLVRVIYNVGGDEAVVVSVMPRRKTTRSREP